MNLFGCTKKFLDKTKNGENVSSLKVVEVVLGQSSLVIININKSLKYYILLSSINLMDIC